MNRSTSFGISVWAAFFLLLFGWGWLSPEAMWGVHSLAFFSNGLALLVFALVVGGYFFPTSKFTFLSTANISSTVWWILSAGLVLLFGWLSYQFPIADDYYGNARSFLPDLDKIATELPEDYWQKVFSLDIKPGNGRWGVYQLIILCSYLLELDYYQAFRWVNTLFGMGFLLVWSRLVLKKLQRTPWRLLFLFIGGASPFLLVFFGHIEAYAPVYFLLVVWCWALERTISTRNKRWWLVLLLINLVSLRFHTLAVLLMPSVLLAGIAQFSGNTSIGVKLKTTRGTLLWMGLPIAVVGLIGYFFVFEDHQDPRALTMDTRDIDRLFLPIISPEAPLDRYNLWSWNHLLDFANALLFWSPAALFLLGSLCIRFKGKIPWDDPDVRLISFALLLFLAMLFMVNPLLSMPMDWDLFCYPATLLMVLSLRVVHRLEPQLKKGRLYLATWGALLLGLPAFWVFTDSGRQQQRMEMIGRHVFKTYYEHSGTYLLYSLQGLPQDIYYEKKQSMVADLQPYALLGRDGKFAELLMDDALFLLMQRKQAVAARKRVLEAYAYDPNHRLMGQTMRAINRQLVAMDYAFTKEDSARSEKWVDAGRRELREEKDYASALLAFRKASYFLPVSNSRAILEMETYYLLKDYSSALETAVPLIKVGYPNPKRAYRMGLQLALEAADYAQAQEYALLLNRLDPQDAIASEVLARMQNNDRVSDLKALFRRQR